MGWRFDESSLDMHAFWTRQFTARRNKIIRSRSRTCHADCRCRKIAEEIYKLPSTSRMLTCFCGAVACNYKSECHIRTQCVVRWSCDGCPRNGRMWNGHVIRRNWSSRPHEKYCVAYLLFMRCLIFISDAIFMVYLSVQKIPIWL